MKPPIPEELPSCGAAGHTLCPAVAGRVGADAYFADMEKMKFKYEIEKTFAVDTDVCLWYTIQMGDKSNPTCGWYHLVNEKISSFRMLFDPRPVLQSANEITLACNR